MAKALGHPLRQRLLQRYAEGISSPSDLALELGATLGDVSYHTKRLLDLGWLEEIRTEQVRGATKHFYRAHRTTLDDDLVSRLPPAARGAIVAEILREVVLDAGVGVKAANVHTSRIVVTLDDEAHAALIKLLAETVESIAELERDSERRNRERQRWEVATIGFPLFED